MAGGARLVTAGTIGKPHGLDGSFAVQHPDHPLAAGTLVTVNGIERKVERRAGTDARPLVKLSGVPDREAVVGLRGELLLVEQALEDGEWLAEDLIGCVVEGVGEVVRVIDAPSCDLLELERGELVPLVGDAIRAVDLARRTITVDREFLRMGDGPT